MPDNVKVIITERNGTDIENEELDLIPSNIPLDIPTLDSDNVEDALTEVQAGLEHLVVPISLIQNGSLSNGSFLGYSNLLPGNTTPVVVPISGVFIGFTWSNKKSTCDFALKFRLDSTTDPVFFTWSVDNTKTADVVLGVEESVVAGQEIYIEYIDEGQNASDASIVLKFKS